MVNRAVAITRPPKHHFFGYYDMRPWDPTGRYHLALEVDFMDRPPTGADAAAVGVVDLQDGNAFLPVAQTQAWNFQQGSMLNWHRRQPRTIIFNDRRDGRFVCVACEMDTGRKTAIGPAIADLSEDGRLAATLNFARIADTRPGYGYAGLADPFFHHNAPKEDGLGILDTNTGRHRLILSFADVDKMVKSGGVDYGPGKIYFNHVLFNPSGTWLSLIVRWLKPPARRKTQLWTVAADGGKAFCRLVGPMVSHYDWKDDGTVIAWAGVDGAECMWEFDALRADRPPLAVFKDVITRDGHICYSRNRKRVACDTYPDKSGSRQLFLADCASGKRIDLGTFYSPVDKPLVEIRCDFHPSFSDDDRQLAFDGMHEGTRQRYVVDLP